MRKTHDYIHHYRGSWRDGGRCRIEIYAPAAGEADQRPVIVASELDDNAGSSVTNMAEYLAAEVVARHFPHLLDAPAGEGQSIVWIEHYPPGRGVPGEYDRVTFAPWRIRAAWLGGTLRPALGPPPLGAARSRGGGRAARAARAERWGTVTGPVALVYSRPCRSVITSPAALRPPRARAESGGPRC